MPFHAWRYVIPLRLRSLFRRSVVDRELDEELQYHVEQQTLRNIERGMTPDTARTAALRAIGGIEQRKEECRDQRRWAVVDNATRDLRHAGRVLRGSPVFTIVAVCILGLGIGANAAIFQLIDAVRLRALPIERPHELAEIRMEGGVHDFGVSNEFSSQMTYPLWEQLRQHQQPFQGLFAWGTSGLVAGEGSSAQRLETLWVSGEFFPVLGVQPARGRLLTPSDDTRGCGAGPVVISHAFWQSYFGGADAIGRTLIVEEHPFTVIGVTPAGFTGLEVGRGFEIALPTCSVALWGELLDERHRFWLTVMGRLKPEWTLARASDHVRTLSPALLESTLPPGYDAANIARYRRFRMEVLPAGRGISRLRVAFETPLWLLLGTTALILLITCGNLATLMLARASARAHEITVRVALGASRARVVSQLSVESLLVALGGAALAIPVALLSSRALTMFLEQIDLDLTPDWRIVSFTGAVAGLTVLLFGVLPALRASIVSPIDAMRQAARSVTVDRRRSAFQAVLVAGQIAISLVLVVSALLFVRSLRNLASAETGFEGDQILVASFIDRGSASLAIEQRQMFQRTLTETLRSTPGVAAAATSSHIALSGSNWWHFFRPPGKPDERAASRWNYVSPGYFDTMQIPLVAGRDIADLDTSASRRVAVVNQAFVREHLAGREPLGAVLHTLPEPGYPAADYEIVGIVKDTMYTEIREGLAPIVFTPVAQHPDLTPWETIVVRTRDSSPGMVAEMRRRVAGLNPGMVVNVMALTDLVRERLTAERMLAWLGGSFGVLAMTLASTGLYGLIAYLAAGRRHEVGIRLSLGSSRARLIGMFLRTSAWPIACGLAVGLPIAIALMRGAGAILFGLSPTDAVTLASAALLLVAAGGLAALIPAWRASRLNPTAALRSE